MEWLIRRDSLLFRFGWVNASYVYGLQMVNAHMRRALGTLTPYETFIKAVKGNREKALAELG
jgi:alpha,alpha-trehalase